jgi:WD40 repeat protein
VLTGSDDKTARLWSAATGRELTAPLRHRDPVVAVAFSPDGKVVLTNDGKAAHLWRIPAIGKGDPKRIKLWTQVYTGLDMDELGELHSLDSQTWHERRRQLLQMGRSPLFEEYNGG